jgi:MoaA/NifB/PqqE/SkfB family radical SAM enzyme
MPKASPIDPKIAKVENVRTDPATRLHKDIRIFGGSFIVILGIIAGIAFWRAPESWMTWLWIPAIAIGLPALVHPPAMKQFYRGWMFFASILGWIISRILFSVFYYIIISPVALFFRLIGRDHLKLRHTHDTESNWTEVGDTANKDYLAGEKIQPFHGRHVVNTHFPPYPSGAFDTLVEHFNQIGETVKRKLYSVTLAVTNRCEYNCWHCYNANRSQEDIPGETLKSIIRELQDMGTVTVTLTGGEPLLRKDLEEIAASFDERTCLNLNTTGSGLSIERAEALLGAGLFAAGISLDSEDADEHDRLRGKPGAFETALDALAAASRAGLYPYIIAVATRDFLKRGRFISFMEFARDRGALEVHLLEPSATGKLAGHKDILLKKEGRDLIIRYQKEIAEIEDMPILSSITYLESSGAFGCGAGLTHLYIDGSGEVCPCNLVPLSFGNIRSQSLESILDDMAVHFSKPRCNCVGKILSGRIPEGETPAPPEVRKLPA